MYPFASVKTFSKSATFAARYPDSDGGLLTIPTLISFGAGAEEEAAGAEEEAAGAEEDAAGAEEDAAGAGAAVQAARPNNSTKATRRQITFFIPRTSFQNLMRRFNFLYFAYNTWKNVKQYLRTNRIRIQTNPIR